MHVCCLSHPHSMVFLFWEPEQTNTTHKLETVLFSWFLQVKVRTKARYLHRCPQNKHLLFKREKCNLTMEQPGRHPLNHMTKVSTPSGQSYGHRVPRGSAPSLSDPEKSSDQPKLTNVLQNTWPELSESVNEARERQGERGTATGWRRLKVTWDPASDLETEKH